MPRRGNIAKREIQGDPIYNSITAARFMNKVMWDGKKSLSQNMFYGAMDIIQKKTGKEPIEVFEQAIKNAMPVLEVRPRRVGGATYQVPMEVRSERRISLAIRWLVQYARDRAERTMEERLAQEIMDAANNTGTTIKKKEDTHKMAESNRAFAHYKW